MELESLLDVYSYAVGAKALGLDPYDLTLRLDVLLKTKTPELIRLETSRTERNRQRFVRLVEQVWQGIVRGIWYP